MYVCVWVRSEGCGMSECSLSRTTWWKPVKLLVAAQLLKAELCAVVVAQMWEAECSRTLCGQAAAVVCHLLLLCFLLHVFVCVSFLCIRE